MTEKANETHRGHIFAVRGNVIDVCFPRQLPARYHQLKTGEDDQVILEVQTHLSDERFSDAWKRVQLRIQPQPANLDHPSRSPF